MCGSPKLIARLKTRITPIVWATESTPRPRAITKAAPKMPKTAPEAPIVSWSGPVSRSAPKAPANSEAK